MSTSSTSLNDLADDSLAHIFAFIPPDERVRLERVCRKWGQVAQKHAWTEHKKLKLDWEQLRRQGDKALAKYRALIDRCSPHLRELSTAIVDFSFDQWTILRNLRHLRFDMCVSSGTLRAVTDNLKRLQSIHFSDIDNIVGLHDLLRANNASLQALHLPLCNSRDDPLCLPALPSSLRLLHLGTRSACNYFSPQFNERNCDRVDELLELAGSCCSQLAILLLPIHFPINELSLSKLVRFEKLFYLRLCLNSSSAANLSGFGSSFAKIGTQLRALLLGRVDSRALQLVSQHCPLLEHCSFRITHHLSNEERGPFLSALQSVFQLAHLRSVSICFMCSTNFGAQILNVLNGLIAKGKLEQLLVSGDLPMPAKFVTTLIQLNPVGLNRLRKLTCAIRPNQMSAELGELKMLLQHMDRPLAFELIGQIPPELEMGENTRVRVIGFRSPEHCSVPELDNLDDCW